MRKISNRYLTLGLGLYIAGLFAVHQFWSDHIHIVWTGMGVATAGLALAALITAVVKVREYMDRTDELEAKVNGGLQEAARTHLQDNELFESLIVRVDRAEDELAQQRTAEADCQDALTELREWVVDRLDQTGNGRAVERTT